MKDADHHEAFERAADRFHSRPTVTIPVPLSNLPTWATLQRKLEREIENEELTLP